ncbi:hypothetical protein [Ideonella sp. A 288]|uniref:hypothetical protein n=1 Tax=Ideonella sp. A 288 TaxID=1962181 RepID=UPI000B4B9C7C|nr:hypothetical protein [Ideonella sp. A 288]
MAPVIPTHRPLVTPVRLAIAIAVAAVLSGVFLAVDAAEAQSSTAQSSVGADPRCGKTAAAGLATELVVRSDAPRPLAL